MALEPAAFQIPCGVFETRMEVRWGDVDSMHHVNNTVYFRYFEEARVRLFRCAADAATAAPAIALAHASCDFLMPLRYPALIVVGLKPLRLGRTSLELECWVAAAVDPRIVYARGRSVVVRVDEQTQRPMRWTAADRRALAQGFSA